MRTASGEQSDQPHLLDVVEQYTERFAQLDSSGEATLPAAMGLPERTLEYKTIAAGGKGWKLHLNFDAEQPTTFTAVEASLSLLKDNQMITTYKIGHGGGKEDDQPGKEATVYIGHKDKAKLASIVIEKLLSNVLEKPEGTTLHDDIPFTPKTMARFEVTDLDDEFHQYGWHGVPFLKEDMTQLIFGAPQVKAALKAGLAYKRAVDLLRRRYGTFYTGSQSIPAWLMQ